MLRDGAFRWNRFENLLREGSQSSDFDPEQLWVLAKWLISPSADAIRRPLADEFVRLVDGFAAGSVREQIHATVYPPPPPPSCIMYVFVSLDTTTYCWPTSVLGYRLTTLCRRR